MENQVVERDCLRQRTRRKSLSSSSRTSRAWPRAFSGRSPRPTINVDMIVQSVTPDGKHHGHDISRCRRRSCRARLEALKGSQDRYWLFRGSRARPTWPRSPVIGIGMRSHAGVAAQDVQGAVRARASTFRRSQPPRSKSACLIDAAYAELAVSTLHSIYGLDAD